MILLKPIVVELNIYTRNCIYICNRWYGNMTLCFYIRL